MWCRGIRGATVVANNTRDNILAAAEELLKKIIESNHIDKDLVACVYFTTTSDLNAEFPAVAARRLGWTKVALLCGQEINVPDSLPKCLRILILYNTDKKAEEIVHVYINGAEVLRHEAES